ncbi:MAG: carotenoid oxygenase family protein [Ilumatobacteraceae bacterium]
MTGANAPVTEEITAVDLEVVGELPDELDGRFLRNGPNPLGPVDPATHHWFVGDAMVHGVRLRDGRAEWYRNRWVRSDSVADRLGEPHRPGVMYGGMDTANTNVIGLAGRTLAVVEAGARPFELSFDLDTIERCDFGGTLPHGYAAHPKRDPATGDLHAIAYHWALPHIEYVVVDATGRVRSVEAIEVDGGPMVHDCAITERYVVVMDLPVAFDIDDAMAGVRFPYAWDDARAARVGLVPLGGSGSDVRWFDIAPSYVFHPLNAWDDGERVIVDVVRYERVFDAHRLGPDDSPPQLWRWTIDTATGQVREDQLSDRPLEFPRVDERRVGRRHTVGWATEVRRDHGSNGFGGRLMRIDGATGDMTTIDLGPGRQSGEWVMVPRDVDAAEDDGWLMSFVYDPVVDRSSLVVLPAADPGAGPVASVTLPTRVPRGFHGNWVPAT